MNAEVFFLLPFCYSLRLLKVFKSLLGKPGAKHFRSRVIETFTSLGISFIAVVVL
jgi:hypothetical protein